MAGLQGLDPSFAQKIQQMIAASGGKITIQSGFRDNAQQTQLWNAAIKKYGSESAARKWVAPPGSSNHERGFAVDLGGDLALAHQLAPRFGLNFPMAHEAWHVEPAGLTSSKDAHTPAPGLNADGTADSTDTRTASDAGETDADRKTLKYQLMNFVNILGAPNYIDSGGGTA